MDELQKLYDVLTRDGYYTKSFDDFKVQFQDPGYQDKVYGVVERDGLFTKGKDAFIQKYTSQEEPIAVKKKNRQNFRGTKSQRSQSKNLHSRFWNPSLRVFLWDLKEFLRLPLCLRLLQ